MCSQCAGSGWLCISGLLGYLKPSGYKASYFTALCFQVLIRTMEIKMIPLHKPGFLPEAVGQGLRAGSERRSRRPRVEPLPAGASS